MGPRVSVPLSVLKKDTLNYNIKPVDKRYIVISKKDNNTEDIAVTETAL